MSSRPPSFINSANAECSCPFVVATACLAIVETGIPPAVAAEGFYRRSFRHGHQLSSFGVLSSSRQFGWRQMPPADLLPVRLAPNLLAVSLLCQLGWRRKNPALAAKRKPKRNNAAAHGGHLSTPLPHNRTRIRTCEPFFIPPALAW